MNTEDLPELDREVMNMLLAGDHPVLVTLREQFRTARVASRTLTGVGFFTDFIVSADVPRVSPPNFEFGDVEAEIKGLPNGARFLLFIRDGIISALEGYCVDKAWPEESTCFTLRYVNPRGASLNQNGRYLPPECGGRQDGK